MLQNKWHKLVPFFEGWKNIFEKLVFITKYLTNKNVSFSPLKEIMMNKIKWQVYMRNIHVREFLFTKLRQWYFFIYEFQKIGSKIWHFFKKNIKYQNNMSHFFKQTCLENEHRDLYIGITLQRLVDPIDLGKVDWT